MDKTVNDNKIMAVANSIVEAAFSKTAVAVEA